MAEKLTLASMCAGGVQERIDRALAKISDNILDLNTDAKKKRVLDVKITLTPSEDDREDVSVEAQTSVKLAPEMGLKTQLFINKDFRSGVTTLTEHSKGAIKGQLTLKSGTRENLISLLPVREAPTTYRLKPWQTISQFLKRDRSWKIFFYRRVSQ